MLILVNEFRSVMSFPTVKQIMVVAKLMDGFIEGFVQVKYIAGTYLRSFLSLGQDDDGEEARALRALQLEFEVPRNFLNPDKYRPDHVPEDDFGEVPDVITRSIFDVMDANVPIDALNPFIYLRSGRLPEFVVVFFMNMVAKRVKSKMSRFFHAMHLIEMYREYITSWLPSTLLQLLPPTLSALLPPTSTRMTRTRRRSWTRRPAAARKATRTT